MKKLIFIITIGILFPTLNFAQPHDPPDGIELEEFRTWLKSNWFDGYQTISLSTSSGYTEARLEMYNILENQNDTMYCLYSGMYRVIPAGGFTVAGHADPFDCEHIVPQSLFGSEAPMKNDIHHLAPTFSNWNSTRGNMPYNENADSQTEKWIRNDELVNCSNNPPCIPGSFLDEFSEVIVDGNNSTWEPREDAKGNVARSVFYFFTMYPDYDITSVGNIQTLYQWHLDDPVNNEDDDRNQGVDNFQGNRNPYIDHPEWVERAWIGLPVSNKNIIEKTNISIEILSNPIKNKILTFSIENPNLENLTFSIYSTEGKKILEREIKNTSKETTIQEGIKHLDAGLYWLHIKSSGRTTTTKAFIL